MAILLFLSVPLILTVGYIRLELRSVGHEHTAAVFFPIDALVFDRSCIDSTILERLLRQYRYCLLVRCLRCCIWPYYSFPLVPWLSARWWWLFSLFSPNTSAFYHRPRWYRSFRAYVMGIQLSPSTSRFSILQLWSVVYGHTTVFYLVLRTIRPRC